MFIFLLKLMGWSTGGYVIDNPEKIEVPNISV